MAALSIRPALFGALLALLALVGMTALSGWHGAHIHAEGPAHMRITHAQTDAGRAGDGETLAHVAAHVVGHGFAVPQPAALAVAPYRVAAPWSAAPARALADGQIATVLRPPRA